MKNAHTPNRRLSVLVPSVPKDYFSSQNARDAEAKGDEHKRGADTGVTSVPGRKQLTPAASIRRISAEGSTSTSKRGGPYPGKSLTVQIVSRNPETPPKAMSKHKSGVSKEMTKTYANGNNEDVGEKEADDTSMIVDASVTSTSRGGLRRSAANKATARLREEIMPDVVSFEREQKQVKRRWSEDWESVASMRGGREEERGGKQRKVLREEEVEEAEVEEVVFVPSVKAK